MQYMKIFTDFATSIEPLGDAERGRLFTAMLEYAATGAEPEFSGNERYIWPTAKMHIDRNAAEYARKCTANANNGAKGGRPRKKPGPLKNPENPVGFLETQKSQDKDKDKDKDKIPPFIPPQGETGRFCGVLKEAVADWIRYKQERRQPYKPTGLKSLLSQIENQARRYGDEAVAGVIRDSMAANYQGIVFDRLGRREQDGGAKPDRQPAAAGESRLWGTEI